MADLDKIHLLFVAVTVTECPWKRGRAFIMCDSGPTLSHKPLLGQLATCVPLEVCVLQLSTHAKMNLGLPDIKQKV